MAAYLPGPQGSSRGSTPRKRFGARLEWTAADKARIVATVLKDGVPAAQVARSHGLEPSRVYNWISAVRAGRLVPAAKGLALPKLPGTAMTFARVVTSGVAPSFSSSPRVGASGIMIELGDTVIHVHSGADVHLLREVFCLAREASR